MITKEVAARIYNCHIQIDQGNKMIEELKKNINDKGESELRFQFMLKERNVHSKIWKDTYLDLQKTKCTQKNSIIAIHLSLNSINFKRNSFV